MFLPAEIIKRKRDGHALTPEEISFFVRGYTAGTIPDYQMSAFLMAVFFKDMTNDETLQLTQEMLFSGHRVDLSHLPKFKVDKHSTGGVGDKTSLVLGPIVAAAGLAVPMIAGRGLGHTGGTLDKLESIPGFTTQLDLARFQQALEKNSIGLIGQTHEICPADKKIYALRDVTATIESFPLICASIMSKKLAEGIDGLVLDVKFGTGAFMKTRKDAKSLALRLMEIARGAGKKVATILTSMDQPLGAFAGNSLEVEECIRLLRGDTHLDARGINRALETRELSLHLSAWMLYLGGTDARIEDCLARATQVLDSGQALEKFNEMCRFQGGNLSRLPSPRHRLDVFSTKEGFVGGFETERIGWTCVRMRAGRAQTTDLIEPTAGIEFHVKIGDRVVQGDPILTLYGADAALLQSVAPDLQSCLHLHDEAPPAFVLIDETLS